MYYLVVVNTLVMTWKEKWTCHFSLLFKSHPPNFLTIRSYGSVYLIVQVGYLKAIFDSHLFPRVPHLSVSFNFLRALKYDHACAP